MGRSSGGGGGHSSGGFGGGHSSGGFSGGGRSSSSRSHSSSFGGGHSGYHHHSWGPPPPYGYRSGGSFWYVIFVIFIIAFIYIGITSESTSNLKSTKERTPLNGVVSKTEWYEDNIGWVSSKNVLIEGLEDFYKQTGVQPYVLFVPYSDEYWNGSSINATNADKYLEEVYSNKFKDEAHFIFAYFQCKNDSKSEMDGEFRYLSGYSADTIMDSEAISILWGYFSKNYYNTSLSMEKMISKTFSETADSIMSKPTNVWDFGKILVIGIVVIIVIIVIYKYIKNKNKREKEKEEFTEKVLSKPLETFGNDTSELEKKYEDKE